MQLLGEPPLDATAKLIRVAVQDHFRCIVLTSNAVLNGHHRMHL